MTKETKIGLLVGMAVIILIGILISDHLSMAQRQQSARRPNVAPELASDQLPPPANIVLSHGDARTAPRTVLPMPPELASARSVAPAPALAAVPAAQPVADSAATLRQSLQPAASVATTSLEPAPVAESPVARPSGPSNNLLVALNDAKPIEGDVPPGFERIKAKGADLYGNPPAEPTPVNTRAIVEPAAPVAATASAKPQIIHHVQSGETLQSISRKYFKNDPNHDKTIFEANRKSIPAMNKLRAGVRLVIPTETVAAAKPTALAATETVSASPAVLGANPKKPADASTPGTVDYTVKEGQTLSSIAATAFGSKNDWKKLYDLNKDRIKDPNRLAPGTIIRVPKKS